jgi:hypothetical protein
MRNFIFRCPATGLNVQGSEQGAESDEGTYTAQKCLVRAGVHLVNTRTGKLLFEDRPPPRPDPR